MTTNSNNDGIYSHNRLEMTWFRVFLCSQLNCSPKGVGREGGGGGGGGNTHI